MERDDLQILIDRAHGDGFDYVDLTVEDARSLLSLIDQYKKETEKQTKISMDAIYENTLLQLKLDQANQTIEAYRALEKE